ncbi:hypothetical protein C8R44DRAFT_981898 [Mycena epipterygia]|nr:hypothetical protein C8R44DRAFT_981898 [Mycena epipterygia]
MPGRRRGRARLWTHTKSKSINLQFGEPTAPTASVWATLEQLGSFIIVDEDGQEYKFSLNDVAAVVPLDKHSTDLPLDQYWMVRIKGIRSTPGGEVWVQINWYYSPHDVSEKMPSFNPSHCAKHERIYSHHSEIISSLTFEAVVPMADFLEDDPNQVPILRDQFFCRYFLDTNQSTFKISQYTSNVEKPMHASNLRVWEDFGCNSCLCGEPYSPEDMDPRRVMHWCPRPNCRRAYHRSCLLQRGHHKLFLAQQDIICARLASSPDTDDQVTFPDEYTMMQLPSKLMSLAAQPLVRGGTYGVAGNVAVIVLARRAVHAAFRDHRRLLDSGSDSDSSSESRRIVDVELDLDLDLDFWDKAPGFHSWKDAIVQQNLSLWEDGDAPAARVREEGISILVCPDCAGAV